MIPRESMLYKVSKTPSNMFKLDTAPEFCTRDTRHFLHNARDAAVLESRASPVTAERTARHDAHQHAYHDKRVRSLSEIMPWRRTASKVSANTHSSVLCVCRVRLAPTHTVSCIPVHPHRQMLPQVARQWQAQHPTGLLPSWLHAV